MRKPYYKYKYIHNIEYLGLEDDQPLNGLIAILGLNHNILVYNKKLKSSELDKFELELIEIIGNKIVLAKKRETVDDLINQMY